MANLGRRDGIYHVRFRYAGKEYKKSLKVRDRADAEAAKRVVEQTIHRLLIGLIELPDRADVGDFIISGGKLILPPIAPQPVLEVPSVGQLIDAYLQGQKHRLAESTHELFTIHLNHWRKRLGNDVGRPCQAVTHGELERHLQARITTTSSATAAKERRTLLALFRWAVGQGYLETSPAGSLAPIAGETDKPPFRTLAEIRLLIERGGLSAGEALGLWECLFLSPSEIAALLTTVRDNASDDVTPLLHAVPAYTGIRRGELLRLRWADTDLARGLMFARSRKQSRQRVEVVRRIDLHPELVKILVDWRSRRPKGQYVVCDVQTLEPYTNDEANRAFWAPLRGTEWCLNGAKNWFKVGFHSYRHSFASNLAARGVDQRIIDEWMGHSTEAMRRRYRHLFPSDRRSAIESFSLLGEATEQRGWNTEVGVGNSKVGEVHD